MIPFHCPIESQEHILSWVYRLHLLSGNRYFKQTANFIGVEVKPLKPCNYNETFKDTISLLAKTSNISTDSIFEEHTPAALWSLSFYKNEYHAWRTRNDDVMPQSFDPSKFAIRSTWQYCNECVEEDIALMGHSMWHVKHQLPSVMHCYKHKSRLISDDVKLQDLKAASLPQVHSLKEYPTANESLLVEWSSFVIGIFERLNANNELGQLLQHRIRQHLSIADDLKNHKDNEIFNSLEAQFRNEVPLVLLQHLFTFFSKQYNRDHTVLRSTLGWSQHNRPKHPIYWLIIIYWLKDKISLDYE